LLRIVPLPIIFMFHFSAKRPLIAGSVGSYGATLHDGSEYTGSFINSISREDLKEFHRDRIEALLDAGVDLLAMETIPVLGEALVLLDLISEYPHAKAWLSFQCRVRIFIKLSFII